MGYSRQEYWSSLPFPPAGDLPNPGIKPVSLVSPAWQVDSSPLHHLGSPDKTETYYIKQLFKKKKKGPISLQLSNNLMDWLPQFQDAKAKYI